MQDFSGTNDGTLKMRIYRSMLNDILEGRYVPERPFTEKELTEKYHAQLDYYARALEQLTGKKVKEKIIYSFTLKQEIRLP